MIKKGISKVLFAIILLEQEQLILLFTNTLSKVETEARKRNIEYYNEILWKKECVKEIRFFNLAEWIENKRRKT